MKMSGTNAGTLVINTLLNSVPAEGPSTQVQAARGRCTGSGAGTGTLVQEEGWCCCGGRHVQRMCCSRGWWNELSYCGAWCEWWCDTISV